MPNIKISIRREQAEAPEASPIAGVAPQQAPTAAAAAGTDAKKMAPVSIFATAAISKAKQAVSYGLSNVGSFTGNYVRQNRIDFAMDVFSHASTVAMGAIAGGWVGAILATATVAMNVGLREYSRVKQNEFNSLNAMTTYERSGNQLFDGSRGTEE